jgi:tetratricopeptide (TPR) repeat protein
MAVADYRNFPVRASKRDIDGRYSVTVVGLTPDRATGETDEETLHYDKEGFVYREAGGTVQLLEAVEQRPVRQEYLFALGSLLADFILPEMVRKRFLKSLDLVKPAKRLRLRLILVDPVLAALPWEFIYLKELARNASDPQGFLALRDDVSIVRHESIDQPEPPLPRGGSYRLVAAFASPSDQDALDTDADRSAIEAGIAGADGFSISSTWVEGATRKALEQALGEGCDIFHFSGHAYYDENEQGRILLEKRSNDDATSRPNDTVSDPYEADQLLQLLKGAKAKIAILGACESGKRSAASPWSGIAPKLVMHDLAAVVASQYRLLDRSAHSLAEQLYRSLGRGESIDDGIYEARKRIFQQKDGLVNRDWASLVLYLRVEDGVVFPQETSAPSAPIFPRIGPAPLQIPLVGRDSEVGEFEKEFAPGSRYYCHGPIGVGKTSLTTAVFTKAVQSGKYPRYLWSRVTNDDVDRFLESLAAHFRGRTVSEAVGTDAKIRAMRELLGAHPGLLIGLDEVPNDRIAKVILEVAANSSVLLNGQRVLNLGGTARARKIEPLALPDAAGLFFSVANLTQPTSAADKQAIEDICIRMRLLPLGITLAAQRCSEGESPQVVLQRVKNIPEAFAAEDAEVSVLFKASFKELARSLEGQRLLVRLAWYPTREAPLEALRVGQPDFEFFQAKDKALALGLITAAGQDRVAQHPLMGGLAQREAPASLLKSEEAQVTQWLIKLARSSGSNFEVLDREKANLLGLLERKKSNRAVSNELVGALFEYLRIRGHWKELLLALDRLLPRLTAHGSTPHDAWNLFRRGIVHTLQGSYESALRDLRNAQQLFSGQNDAVAVGRTMYRCAVVSASQGRLNDAVRELKNALELMGEAPERASAHSALGSLLAAQGDVRAGRRELRNAIEIAEAANHLEQMARAYIARGALADQAGDGDSAQADFDRALDAATKIGDPTQIAFLDINLGYFHYQRGRFTRARILFEKALVAFEELDFPRGMAKGLHALGDIELAEDNLPAAANFYKKALALNNRHQQTGGAVYDHYQLGIVAQRQADPSAASHFKTVMDYGNTVNDVALISACLAQLARLSRDLGETDQAIEYGQKSLQLATRIEDRLTAATALYNLALANADKGNIDQASQSWTDAHAAFAAFGDLNKEKLENLRVDIEELKRNRDNGQSSRQDVSGKVREMYASSGIDGNPPSPAAASSDRIDRTLGVMSPDNTKGGQVN